MAEIVACKNIAKSYHSKSLFEQLNFSIADKERVGLIGPNGAGKTTVLKILARIEPPDGGEVVTRKFAKITLVPQNSDLTTLESKMSVFDYGCSYAKNLGVDPAMIETKVAIALNSSGFKSDQQIVGELSGGWQKRLRICLAETLDPDLILFDEPTNHLDIKSTLWLESKLVNSSYSWLCVSHDRFFLNRTTNRTIEINPIYKEQYFSLELPYEQFIEKRYQYFLSEKARAESLQSKLRKENEWLSRQPKARTTKSKSRIESALSMQSELSTISSRLNQSSIKLDLQASGRQTKSLIKVKNVSKQFDNNKLFSDINLELTKGLKLGLLGDNGSGKTTLLKMIAKILPPDQGEIIFADNLNLTFFEQTRDSIPQDWTLKRALCEEGDHVIFQDRSIHVTAWAARFHFPVNQLDAYIKDLSGGELARVYISKLMLRKADLMILDEPTNDLDITTLELLEDCLNEFSGSLVIVSHDRYFLTSICNQFLALDGNEQATFYASYEQWEKTLLQSANKKKSKKTENKQKKSSSNKKLSYMAQREYDTMEKNILSLEEKLSALQLEASKPQYATNAGRLAELGQEITDVSAKLEKMYERWSELESMQV